MGAPYEFNWYLVIANTDMIKQINNIYSTIKSEGRIYPIDSEIPIIVKEKGCIGIVKILKFSIDKYNTEVEFEYVSKLDATSEIAKHYYEMYLNMKSSS
jgi:hypothetical protein